MGADLAALGADHSGLRRVAEVLDTTGAGGPATVVLAVALVLLWRSHPRLAAWLAASAIGTLLVRIAVRETIGRERPLWPEAAALPDTPAFPSGHTTTGIAVWAVLGIVLLVGDLGRPARWLGVVLVVCGVLMGPSRLVLGVHWPSDVLGGWLLASGVALVAGAVVLARR